MDICDECKAIKEEDGSCNCNPFLDEEDLQAKLDADAKKEEGDDPIEPDPDEKKEDDPVEPDPDPDPEKKETPEWQKQAAEAGWTPDHVRQKHANEAQTLRQQVEALQRINDAQATRQEPVEEADPNEGVTRGELDGELATLHDKAILSEKLIRMDKEDYDEVIGENLVPLVKENPWIEEFLYGKPNPAKAAYEFGKAIKDGKKVTAEFVDGKMQLVIPDDKAESDAKPEPKDPNRPDPKALEQANKQPKTLDSVPAAKSTEATEMSVEDFWNLPSDTLMRIRSKNQDLYEKMQAQFHEKYK
jgi:hypothetical protein